MARLVLKFQCTDGLMVLVRSTEIYAIWEDPDDGFTVITLSNGQNYLVTASLDTVESSIKRITIKYSPEDPLMIIPFV
ncbi:hypothetical protein [Paenibacillus qinlingensis]|uniref:Uncharacterized protein YlzI (FlbEa/FlbD family) n=1 Tax=Paenibacillus qinlingensis TaxID=1837343 RepID=A0ABU1P790_9BACL|nr:hypothetical protein [Paenibacillus qinlingensis]MDR6555449.1 uncharacterized protein YlzI (FlbEa/FlbD family) [Paenibacillus qinlingensis]